MVFANVDIIMTNSTFINEVLTNVWINRLFTKHGLNRKVLLLNMLYITLVTSFIYCISFPVIASTAVNIFTLGLITMLLRTIDTTMHLASSIYTIIFYRFITKVQSYLIILSSIEYCSSYFQCITLVNRLCTNLLASLIIHNLTVLAITHSDLLLFLALLLFIGCILIVIPFLNT